MVFVNGVHELHEAAHRGVEMEPVQVLEDLARELVDLAPKLPFRPRWAPGSLSVPGSARILSRRLRCSPHPFCMILD